MRPDRTDPYAVLGLTRQATQEQIQRAYRTLMRRHHPDTRPMGDPAEHAASNTTLQQVTAAYAVLGDPARRASYDNHHTTPDQPSTPTPIRVLHLAHSTADQPPIQAGPVRWHYGPR
jgi:curved DNA-binding protein CbpA